MSVGFQEVFEGNADPELLVDREHRVVAASVGYLHAERSVREQVVGRSIYDVAPYAGVPRLAERLRSSLETVFASSVTTPNRLDDPAVAGAAAAGFTWATTRAVLSTDGEVRYVVHTLRMDAPDGAGESDRERRLRKLIEHSYDTLALFDVYGRLLFVSPSIKRVLDYTEAEAFEQPPMSFIDPRDYAQLAERFREVLARPDIPHLMRFRARRRDGSWRTLECASRNLLQDRDVAAVVANFRDITEHVELEAELRRTNDQLQAASLERERLFASEQQANRTKDEFLAMLGHELRNPLSPIVTALQLMRMRDPTTLQKERTVIERQVQHLIRLVDDLLDVSRITRGKLELTKRKLELAEVVSKAVEMVSPLLERYGHVLKTDVPAAGLMVNGDEMRLAQVVANLLENAAKYTAPGGRIEIVAAAAEGRAELRVRDSGRGISPELLPRLFDQFVQGERAPDRSEGGLGLGLTIVRSLVELHGGTVTAASAGPGQGSQFTVYLPLARTELEAGPAPAARYEPSGLGPAARSLRVLVVDDNRDACDLLAQALTSAGHTVRIALDGPEALALLREWKPDLALLDIGLPVMDGYELARRIRADPRSSDVKLVAITGYGQRKDREQSAAAGFCEHLVKPVKIELILQLAARLFADPSSGKPPVDAEGSG